MNLLPSSTIRLIASSQVITSVSSVVKELIENSLDAGASSIEIKLDGWGLERIEVRDNGCGVKPDDAPYLAKPHYTSKILTDDDLKSLQTYGFRGEALASLSSVSNLSILTKTKSEEVGMLYTLERDGKIVATKPKPTTTGTIVTAANLFKNLPVRKQFSSNTKKCKEELKRVEDLVMAYAIIRPSLRIILRHNKAVIWQKSKVADERTALLTVFGTSLLAQMGSVEYHDDEESGIHILGYLPRPGSDMEVTGRAVNDRCFIFFNGRPVYMKQISQLIKQYYNRQATVASNRYPVAFLSITIPPEGLDVNLEPNKTSVMLTNQDELMTVLTKLLDEFYSEENNTLPSCDVALENRIVATDKLGDITNTCGMNGEIRTKTSGDARVKNNQQGMDIQLDSNVVHDNMQNKEQDIDNNHSKLANIFGTTGNRIPTSTSSKEKDLLLEESSCHEPTSLSNQGKDALKSSTQSTENAESVDDVPVLCLFSPLQKNSGILNNKDSFQSHILPSKALCESLSDKTLAEMNESVNNIDKTLVNSFKEIPGNTAENGGIEVAERNSVLNNANGNKSVLFAKTTPSENGPDAANKEKLLEKQQELSGNKSLTSAAASSPSERNLFSLSLDDLFEDSDLDTTGPLDDVFSAKKSTQQNLTLTLNKERTTCGEEISKGHSFEGTKVQYTDKQWSMGGGIVDKQGNPVQPVSLVTPGPLRTLSLKRTPLPHLGKRKHSSEQDKSRLSLSSKKIKKMPEITNQPLINKVMSPNPLQRKLLYKKKEVQFSLGDLKNLAKRRAKVASYLEDHSNTDHLIGRLDPWGVWLMQKGKDLVCVNQYRVQEQLLFQRLMACHSLPKERLDHPVILNERSVGGPDCWRMLCNLSVNCDPPDTTRWIDDGRLTANGFDICLKNDVESGETKVELHRISTSIPFYGVPDLVEVLELICQKDGGDSNSLSKCRPFKVIHYLQGEAVRVARSLSSRMNRSEVDELLSRMEKEIPLDLRKCVHDRPFFLTIAQIPE